MSGHSGFQPIGNNLPPILPQPQIGDVRGPGQAQEPQPPNSVKPVNGKSPFPPESEIVGKAARQTRSIFFRDLFNPLKRKGWFSD